MLFGVVCNVSGGWLRYVAVIQNSWAIALTSSILIGCSSAVIIMSVAMIPETRFPAALRTLATSIGVQCNYFGWGLSTVLIPYSISNEHDMKKLLFIQGLVVSASLVVFLAFYSSPPKRSRASEQEAESFFTVFANVLKTLGGNSQYLALLLCYSILGGVSFSITAVQAEIFENMFSTNQGAWTNFCFVMSGVAGGLTFGSLPQHIGEIVITICFVVASLSLTALTVLCHFKDHFDKNHSGSGSAEGNNLLYGLCLMFMGLSGVTTLGFIGPALSKACRLVPKIPHSWSGGGVEWWIQVFGAVLALVSTESVGFAAVAGCSWVATFLLFFAKRWEVKDEETSGERDALCTPV